MITYEFSSDPTILPGNGDGTFAEPVIGLNSFAGKYLVVGDLNGIGSFGIVTADATGSTGTVLLPINQTASASVTGVTVPGSGQHAIAASYSGDSHCASSTSGFTNLLAEAVTLSVSLTSSANPAIQGIALTLTAQVTGEGVTPTGTVIFYDGTTQLGSSTLNSSGLATFTTSSLAAGTHSITASYSGDSNYSKATSAALAETVAANPTVTVIPAAATVTNAQSDAITVTVAGGSGQATPTGSVILASGAYTAPLALDAGSASFIIPAGTLSSGANILTASYSGDATYASSSGTATVTVSQLVVTASTPTQVLPGNSTPATVTLSAGSTYSGTMNLTCALTGSPTGAQSLPTCSLLPVSLSFTSGGSGTTVLTVNTTAASSSALLRPSRLNQWAVDAGSAALAVLLTLGIPRRRRRWLSMLVLLLVVVTARVFGCGDQAL